MTKMKDLFKDILRVIFAFIVAILVGYLFIYNAAAYGECVNSKSEYWYETDGHVYHVGETYENHVTCYVTVTNYVVGEDDKVVEFEDTYNITESFISGYAGITLTEAGEFYDTLNGENGLIRIPFTVYDYGDINGDFELTVSDIVELYRVLSENSSVEQNYMSNADVNNDGIIDLLDVRALTNKIS